jgi:hypothetical protein
MMRSSVLGCHQFFQDFLMSKKKATPKATNTSIRVEFEEDQFPARARLRTRGDITFFDAEGNELKPKLLQREVSHERTKGPKVRTRQLLDHGIGAVSGLQQLANYDVIFAIDTNTAIVEGAQLSVTGFIPFSLEPNDEGYLVKAHETQVQLYEFSSVPEKPELFAILKLANDLSKVGGVRRGSTVAIITDTELDSLDDFNSRKLPIYDGTFLPAGFTLLYTSSDTGAEVPNKFIRICDKAAELTINERRAGEAPSALFQPIAGFPQVGIRVGRRNGILTIGNPQVTDTELQVGQEVTLYGVKKAQ